MEQGSTRRDVLSTASSRAVMLLAPIAVSILGFQMARIAAWANYGGSDLSSVPFSETASMWFMGLRFDLKLLAVTWLIPWLFGVFAIFFRPRMIGLSRRVNLVWLLFTLVVFNLLAVSNFLYQGYYHVPFNPTVFGLIDDDTFVVLLSIWQDLPVVRALAVVAVLTYVQFCLWRWMDQAHGVNAVVASVRWRDAGIVLVLLIVLLFIARGRLDAQPINRDDFTVSPNTLLCDIVPNGVTALYYAWQDYRIQVRLVDDPNEGLRALGFQSAEAAARQIGVEAEGEAQILTAMQRATPEHVVARQRPPHVVVVLMESWDAQALARHAPDNNLLGRLEKHIENNYWFPNFTSGARGTHPSIEALLLNTPITPISQGQYWDIDYQTAAVLPFREAGYRTIFMYGGSARWRALHRAMPHLGFDEVLDIADVQKRFPEATTSDNGVHDEFLYRLAHERLLALEREGTPAMIFIVNTSNHTPYEPGMMPPSYVPPPLRLDRFPEMVLPAAKSEIALQGFRYATDQLGALIDQVDTGPLRDKTIVAATGDHYLRNFFRVDGAADTPWMDRVGFFLSVPPAYRHGVHFSPQAFGSHRDIFPTLYHRALSGARYYPFGEDLLSPHRTDENGVGVTEFSNLYRGDEVVLNLRNPGYFRWDETRQRLQPNLTPSFGIQETVTKERARIALQDWMVRLQALRRWPSGQSDRQFVASR